MVKTGIIRMRAAAAGPANHRLGLVAGLLLSVAALSPLPAPAQQFSFTSVAIEGNALIEDETILNALGIARGAAVSGGELNAAGQRLRGTGLFETVEIVPQGSTLVIRVTEYPTINQINFEGNSQLSDEDLAAVVGSVERRVYNPNQAEDDTAAIVQAYINEGRINATVTPQIIRRDGNRVDLVFDIREGGETNVERISFVGNQSFSERRLRGILETRQAGLLRALVGSDTYVAERIDFDRQVLTDFYRSRGYADFTIQNVDVSLTRERDAYLITFNVQEGQQFRFGAVTLTSAIPEADAEAFRAVLRTEPGQIYSPVEIENDVERLERLATQQGLNFVRVEPRITRDERGLLLNVEYALVRGERIFVERIDIEGNNTTLDRVIRNQFRQVEGDPFNPRLIRESAERIRALGFFGAVSVDPVPGGDPNQVVIDVDVEEAPTGSLSFGANFSSDNGFALLATFRERNFLGRGQALNFQISTGENNRIFSFDFAEPQFLNRDLRFGFSVDYRTTDRLNAVYDTETFRLSPSFAFPVSDNGRLSVFYSAEFTELTNVSGERTDPPEDRASLLIFDEADDGAVWTNALGYTYTWDNRRSAIDARTAYVLRFGQEFGVGDTQFIRTTALASAETRVWNEDLTLRATIEGGFLDYTDGSSRVTDRFFMGSRVMRGFEPGGIGPRDATTDDALGGNAFAVARLEAEFPLGLPEEYGISGGAFVDYGSVWDVGNLRSLDPADVLYNDYTPRAVAGLSVFWDTPIGPLRFNFTEALEAEEFDNTRAFEVTVSTSF